MPVPDAVAYVRAALPPPPARVLEIGAGDGRAGRRLRGPATTWPRSIRWPSRRGVLPVALQDLDAPPRRSTPRSRWSRSTTSSRSGKSLRRLSEVLRHGARLVVDEIDVERLDERAAAWWLGHSSIDKHPADHVAKMREHIHSVARIREELAPWFDVGEPVPGAYLYRWKVDPALRAEEERLIAEGALPAIGKRFIAMRR